MNKIINGKKMENRLEKILNYKGLLLRANRKRSSLAASVTVEASLILPLLLFFFINLLGVFDIIKLQCNLEAALHQTGSEIMVSEAATRNFIAGKDGNSAAGIAGGVINAQVAGKKAKQYLGEDYLSHTAIRGGPAGLKFTDTILGSHNDIIDIVASYKVHPLFGIAGFTDFSLEGRFYGHAFTGYDITGNGADGAEEPEELVYITESGTVYHKRLDCSHLKLSVTRISKSGTRSARNINGARYYPCQYCGRNAGQTVYITNYGNRYHTDRNCGGIKRTILTVPISEAMGRRPCSECGK